MRSLDELVRHAGGRLPRRQLRLLWETGMISDEVAAPYLPEAAARLVQSTPPKDAVSPASKEDHP